MRRLSEIAVRLLVFALTFALVVGLALPLISKVLAAGETVQVRLDASQIQPRPLEQLTGQSITKTYSNAWKNLETALAENRTDLIDESFVGYAHDKLLSQVNQQQKTGLSTR